jgi:uncharacterized membrane protein YdbT with pleckstrin-like domain
MREFIIFTAIIISIFIIASIVSFFWDIFTHPIAAIICITFFVLFAKSAYKASQK